LPSKLLLRRPVILTRHHDRTFHLPYPPDISSAYHRRIPPDLRPSPRAVTINVMVRVQKLTTLFLIIVAACLSTSVAVPLTLCNDRQEARLPAILRDASAVALLTSTKPELRPAHVSPDLRRSVGPHGSATLWTQVRTPALLASAIPADQGCHVSGHLFLSASVTRAPPLSLSHS